MMKDIAKMIMDAHDYTEVFPVSGMGMVEVKYRQYAKQIHPDLPTGDAEAFQRLVEFRLEALEMLHDGRWGEKRVLATITSRKGRYEVTRSLNDGDLAKLWLASARVDGAAEQVVVKVALSPKDNDMLAQEARALKKLHEAMTDDDGDVIMPPSKHPLSRHFPELHDTFLHSEGRRRTNVLEYFPGFYTLDEVARFYDYKIPGPHLAWIWRRLLMALGRAHDLGLVHGAVVPSHILVHPETHGVVLIDWCYSVVIDSESETYVKAVVPMFKPGYPEEVLNKEKPTPATDLYMAAYFAGTVATDLPRPFQAYLNGTKLTKASMRPQNAWMLLEEFDEMLKVMGGPYYPRRYVEMPVPVGAS